MLLEFQAENDFGIVKLGVLWPLLASQRDQHAGVSLVLWRQDRRGVWLDLQRGPFVPRLTPRASTISAVFDPPTRELVSTM